MKSLMLKMAVIGGAVAIVTSVALVAGYMLVLDPWISELRAPPAQKLAQSIDKSADKTRTLGRSFARISRDRGIQENTAHIQQTRANESRIEALQAEEPAGPAQDAARAPYAGTTPNTGKIEGPAPPGIANAASRQSPTTGQRTTGSAAPATTGTPTPTPPPTRTPSPIEAATNATDELTQKLALRQEYSPTAYTRAVRALAESWRPRYEQAEDDYEEFRATLAETRALSTEVFNQMDATVDELQGERRVDWDAFVQRSRDGFNAWNDKAAIAEMEAERIMTELRNINAEIALLNIDAAFRANLSTAPNLPASLASINRELERFQRETVRIVDTYQPANTGQE